MARSSRVVAALVAMLGPVVVLADSADESSANRFDGTFDVPGSESSLRIGGFLQADVIYDFDAIGSEDNFNPTTIPTDGGDGTNTRVHAKWTRLNAEFRRPTERGPLRVFVETDFFDDSNALRLRHAYAQVGSLLVGQTWSTFMDESIIPPTLDLEEPRAFVFSRDTMIRWTWHGGEHTEWAVAVEDPGSSVEAPPGVSGSTEDPVPNLVGRFRWDDGSRHVQLSGFISQNRFRADNGEEEDTTIWGLSLSGRLTTFGRDVFRAQASVGPGVSSFRGGIVAAPDENGQLEAVDSFAAMVSYQHFWRDDLYSHLIYNYGEQDNTAGQAGGSLHAVEYAAANLVWQFGEKMSFGGEWLYGSREDNDGASGDAHRLLFVFRMDFF